MNFENIKSVLLTLLVILSLVLTWSLWTYQPQLEKIGQTEYINDVNIGLSVKPAELILPQKILFHKEPHTYGTVEKSEINRIMSSIKLWSIDEFRDISPTVKGDYLDFVHGKDGIEVIFPTEIPIETYKDIMKIEDEEIRNISFDRLIVPVNEDKETLPVAYFVSYENQHVYEVVLNNFSQPSFKREIYNRAISYPKYTPLKIDSFNSVYLQENSVEVNQFTYYSKSLSAEDFKNALFTNPSNVKRDIQPSTEEVYTDGSRAIFISHQGDYLRFVTPSPESDEALTSSGGYIKKSIDFVNDHSGWTDLYQFTNWNPNKKSTMFRLHIDGLPVFHYSGLSSIYLEWNETGLFDFYHRPLFKLQLTIDSETSKVTLPPGQRVIDILKGYKGLRKVKNITIGYQMFKDSTKVTVVPVWCINEDGKWKKVVFDDETTGTGGTIIGLE